MSYIVTLYVADADASNRGEHDNLRIFWDRDAAERNLLSGGVKTLKHMFEVEGDRMENIASLIDEGGQIYAVSSQSYAPKRRRKHDDLVQRIYEARGTCSANQRFFTSEEAATAAIDRPRVPMRDGGESLTVPRELRVYERRDDGGEFVSI